MAYDGYYEFGGNELINALRSETYIDKELPGFPLVRRIGTDAIRLAHDEGPYQGPLQDDAPWVDKSDPATFGFYGIVPTGAMGLADSTRSVSVVESITDGGSVGSTRFASRAMRFTGVLVGRDQAALEAGHAWLARALDPQDCGAHGSCAAADLFFYVDQPTFDPTAIDRDKPLVSRSSFANVSRETSPVSGRFSMRNGPGKARWEPTPTDGTIIQHGLLAESTSTIIGQSDPILLQRTNLSRNPSIDVNATGYTHTVSGALADRVASGGPDGGPFARVRGNGTAVVEFNYAPNPSAEYDMVESGWSTNHPAGIERVEDSAPPIGNLFSAQLTKRLADLTSGRVRIAVLGPDAPTVGAVTLWVRDPREGITTLAPVVAKLTVRDAAGADVSTGEFELTSEWTEQSLNVRFGVGYSVTVDVPFSTSESGIRIDGVSFIPGATQPPAMYFDGDTPDDQAGGIVSINLARDARGLTTSPSFGFRSSRWFGGNGAGGSYAAVTGALDGPTSDLNSYRRKRWATTSAGASTMGDTGFDLILNSSIFTVTPGATYTLSAYARSSRAGRRMYWRINDNTGGVLGAGLGNSPQTVMEAGVWHRISHTFTVPAGVTSVRPIFDNVGTNDTATMWQPDDTLDATGLLVEETSLLNEFYDGFTPSSYYLYSFEATPSTSASVKKRPLTVSDWLGEPGISGSTRISGAASSVGMRMAMPSVPFGGGMASFALKSEGPALVDVIVYDTTTQATISTVRVTASARWQRFSVRLPGQSNAGVRVTTTGPANTLDVDEILVEAGSDVRPYFGVGQAYAGYDVSWLGTPGLSETRALWDEPLVTDRNKSTWRPFFTVIAGRVPQLELTLEQFDAQTIEECIESLEREFRHVSCIEGPTTIRELHPREGAARVVEWTLLATVPHRFSTPQPVLHESLIGFPYGTIGGDDCPPPVEVNIIDPSLPVVPPPPRPPAIPVSNLPAPPNAWRRRFFDIPGTEVSAWSASLPIVKILTKDEEQRNIRVRFHPNPFDFPTIVENETRMNRWESPIPNWGIEGYTVLQSSTQSLVWANRPDQAGPNGAKFAQSTAKTKVSANLMGIRYGGQGLLEVNPNRLYAARAMVRTQRRRRVRLQLTFLNAAGQATGPDHFGSWVMAERGEFVHVKVHGGITSPADAVRCVIIARGEGDFQKGDYISMTYGLLEEGVELVGGYFDGNTPDAPGRHYAWSGNSYNSRSTQVMTPIDPCNWCAEFIVSYLPAWSELVMDSAVQQATVAANARAETAANNLLYGTGGVPMTWPVLECGISYVMTVDTPVASKIEVEIDLQRRE